MTKTKKGREGGRKGGIKSTKGAKKGGSSVFRIYLLFWESQLKLLKEAHLIRVVMEGLSALTSDSDTGALVQLRNNLDLSPPRLQFPNGGDTAFRGHLSFSEKGR